MANLEFNYDFLDKYINRLKRDKVGDIYITVKNQYQNVKTEDGTEGLAGLIAVWLSAEKDNNLYTFSELVYSGMIINKEELSANTKAKVEGIIKYIQENYGAAIITNGEVRRL